METSSINRWLVVGFGPIDRNAGGKNAGKRDGSSCGEIRVGVVMLVLSI